MIFWIFAFIDSPNALVAFNTIALMMPSKCFSTIFAARIIGLSLQLIATEFVTYVDLSTSLRDGTISSRAAQIATYALCGFANLPSIAIQIDGLSALAPNRRSDFAALGLRAMVARALACWMTGAVASLFIGG